MMDSKSEIKSINNKNTFYKMYENLLFGNKLRTWKSVKEFKDSKYNRNIVLRTKTVNSTIISDININNIDEHIESSNIDINNININESAPDSHLIFQGEATLSIEHLTIFISFDKKKMREALKSAKHFYGFQAYSILKKYMSESSYYDFLDLLELYPDSIIEFGVYNINLGIIPHRNTIIWECRNY